MPKLKWMLLEMPLKDKKCKVLRSAIVIDHFESEGKGGYGIGLWGKTIVQVIHLLKKALHLINKANFQIEILILPAA